ncbi:MAG TPA: phasin family protein [Gammaproteobacteria bacterium]|nr:phasin family protein [Gammaproteobacteria bacterium]HRP88029.1 phasin family protein [Gammaproteobacteria bacterium]
MAKHNGTTPLIDNPLTRLVRDSASQAWSVGRGAYSFAGTEGGRLVGSLLSFGGRIDRGAKSRVFEVRSSAGEAWDRLESAFVHRVARTLNSLQIPTARDVHELNARVEALQKAVVALERRAAETARPAGTARAARRKPAARRKSATRGTGKARPAARGKSGS